VQVEAQLRLMIRSFRRPQRRQGPPHAQTPRAINGAVRYAPARSSTWTPDPSRHQGIEVGYDRGAGCAAPLAPRPSRQAKQARDLAEGPYRSLVHQENAYKPGRTGRPRGRVKLVDVTSQQLHVAQLQRRHDRPGPRMAGSLKSTPTTARPARHLRQDGQPANRPAAAVDECQPPACDPAEGRTAISGALSDTQQPPRSSSLPSRM